MAAPIVHVDVRGLDVPRIRDFYHKVFGWERDDSHSIGDYSVGSLGTVEVTAATGPVPEWAANSCTFYIQVDDIEATLEQIELLGGSAIMPKQVGPPDFPSPHINVFTKFLDPAGNIIGLVEKPA